MLLKSSSRTIDSFKKSIYILRMSRKNTKESFESKIEKTDSCWNWLGVINSSGYGSIRFDGKKIGVHRLAYEIMIGPVSENLFVLHKCDNRICVNPDHLWLGTQTDNLKDMYQKGRQGNPYRWTRENNPNTGKPISEKTKTAISKATQRTFRIIDPNGKLIEGINLTQFCKDRKLNQGAMWSVINGRILRHKGYTAAN